MADLGYMEVHAMNRIEARLRVVTTYHETGSIRETARRWHTSRQVGRKWLSQKWRRNGVHALASGLWPHG
jgi:transposase